MTLSPDDVTIDWRARTDLGDINALASSIGKRGQLHPIIVANGGDGYRLIAGMRRLTACKQLRCPVTAVVVDERDELEALDMQMHENQMRKDFDVLESGRWVLRRKQIEQQIFPHLKHGAAGKYRPKEKVAKAASDDDPPMERTTMRAARDLGISERSVQTFVQVAQLPSDRLKAIEEAPTTRERNKASMQLLREVRHEQKLRQLAERAEEVKQKRAEQPPTETEGRIKLKMMDNRAFMADCEPATFDLVLTDPPYESGRQSLVSHIKRGDIKTDFGAWDKLDVGWVLKAAPLVVPGGQFVVFCPLEAIGDYRTVFEACDLTYRGAIVWHKVNPGTVHRPTYLSSCEAVVWATRGTGYYFSPWANAGAPESHNFIEGPICAGRERLDHPTQKPEWIVERLLRQHAHGQARVFDPFCGVGTTLVVCKRMGLEAVGTEIDKGYCGQAVLRLGAMKAP